MALRAGAPATGRTARRRRSGLEFRGGRVQRRRSSPGRRRRQQAVLVWETDAGREIALLRLPDEAWPFAVRFGPDGQRLRVEFQIDFDAIVKEWMQRRARCGPKCR